MCTNQDLQHHQLNENSLDVLEKLRKKYMIEKSTQDTSNLFENHNVPQYFHTPYLFKGYGIQGEQKNRFYKTVNSEYGYYYPNSSTVPSEYFPLSQKFSSQLAKSGLYRNYSLNTQMDRSYY